MSQYIIKARIEFWLASLAAKVTPLPVASGTASYQNVCTDKGQRFVDNNIPSRLLWPSNDNDT